MEIIYKQKRANLLTPEQRDTKFQKDTEYEQAVKNLYKTLPREQAITEKKKLYNEYVEWAISAGLYEIITPQQQLTQRIRSRSILVI